MKKKVKISIFCTKYGHLSIAKAIEDTLSENKNYQIFNNYINFAKNLDKTYDLFYKIFPSLFKIPFKVAEQKTISNIVAKYWDKEFGYKIKNILKEQTPDIIINNHAAFNETLDLFAKNKKLIYINIVPDPRSFHRLTLSKNGYNFVFDEKAKQLALKFGITEKNIITSGWFVRKKFYEFKSTNFLRKRLKIPSDYFTVTIVGGSAGAYGILKTLPSFVNQENPLHIIIVCGESKALYKASKMFSKLLSNSSLKITVLKFTDRIDEYLMAADIVVGKAGPNLLFETTAVKKPFMAVSHIHGQEDGNLEIIKEYGVGVAEENPLKAVRFLRELIKTPTKVDIYRNNIDKLSRYNESSGNVLKRFIRSKLNS